MRPSLVTLACLCSTLTFITAVPVPGSNKALPIPLSNGQELDVLTLESPDQEQLTAERNKGTIDILRDLFPDITKNGATDTQIDLSAINKQLEETIRVARQVKEAEAAAQALAAIQQPTQLLIPSPKVGETIKLSFNNELTNIDKPKSISNELQLSDSKSPASDELSLDSNEDTTDLDDRNKSNTFKRFLQFGGAGVAGGSSSSSSSSGAGGAGGAGGSGNFLFDIVRLFSGSVQTQAGDEASNNVSSSSDGDSDSGYDGYTEGIPGPVTRSFILISRGLTNLIQDLVLRAAATSEKFINYKAKIITALI